MCSLNALPAATVSEFELWQQFGEHWFQNSEIFIERLVRRASLALDLVEHDAAKQLVLARVLQG